MKEKITIGDWEIGLYTYPNPYWSPNVHLYHIPCGQAHAGWLRRETRGPDFWCKMCREKPGKEIEFLMELLAMPPIFPDR